MYTCNNVFKVLLCFSNSQSKEIISFFAILTFECFILYLLPYALDEYIL